MTLTTIWPARARLRPAAFRWGLALAAIVGVQGAAVTDALGQEQEREAVTPPVAAAVRRDAPDSLRTRPRVSPKGAFARAVLLPGWGHAAIGSYTRGGFYFAAEITTGWGLLRTKRRLLETRDRIAFRESAVRAELAAQGIDDPDQIDAALLADDVLGDLNDLAASREDQQEDWAALGIFLLFLSGADAFVSAHLADFPTPIAIEATPLPEGRVEVGVRVPLPNR